MLNVSPERNLREECFPNTIRDFSQFRACLTDLFEYLPREDLKEVLLRFTKEPGMEEAVECAIRRSLACGYDEVYFALIPLDPPNEKHLKVAIKFSSKTIIRRFLETYEIDSKFLIELAKENPFSFGAAIICQMYPYEVPFDVAFNSFVV